MGRNTITYRRTIAPSKLTSTPSKGTVKPTKTKMKIKK